MNTSERSDTNVYQAPGADVVGQLEEFDESSMFSSRGRAGRLRYFGYVLGFSFLAGMAIAFISGIALAMGEGKNAMGGWVALASLVIDVAVISISIIFIIKRLHDLDWTGWLSLLTFVPLVNIIFGLVLLFAPGTAGPNKYGPPPKAGSSAVIIIIGLFLFIAILGILAAIAIPAYQDYVHRAQQVHQTQ